MEDEAMRKALRNDLRIKAPQRGHTLGDGLSRADQRLINVAFIASVRRTCPERIRPSSSACAGGSAFDCPTRARLSDCGKGMLVTDQGSGFTSQQFCQKRISLLHALVELGRR